MKKVLSISIIGIVVVIVGILLAMYLPATFVARSLGAKTWETVSGGRHSEFLTRVNMDAGELAKQVPNITFYDTFADKHFGEFQIQPAKETTISLGIDGNEFVRIKAKGDTNTYEMTNGSWKLTGQGKTAYTITGEAQWATANMEVEFINRDGSILKGPFDNGNLYNFFGYKNGVWTRYAIRTAILTDQERRQYDYSFAIGSLYISIANYKVLQTMPVKRSSYEMYPWTLTIKEGETVHKIPIVLYKNPPATIFVPMPTN